MIISNAYFNQDGTKKSSAGTITATMFPKTDYSEWLYHTLKFVLNKNLSFSCVEDPDYRAVCSEVTSRKTLLKYVDKISQLVYDKIKSLLPSKFGGIIDGWSDGCGTHYMGFYATFMIGENPHKLLLSIAPLLEETNQNADNHVETIIQTLADYGRPKESLTFLVADNTGVNPSIARKLSIPFIGCFSHKFNLALQEVIGATYNDLVEKVKDTFVHIRDLCQLAGQQLWSCWKDIYQTLQPQLDAKHRTLGIDSLNVEETELLNEAVKTLKKFNAITKRLQDCFGGISSHEELFITTYAGHNNSSAELSASFISAVCKIQARKIKTLTVFEKELLDRAFYIEKEIIEIDQDDEEDDGRDNGGDDDDEKSVDFLKEADKKCPKLESDEYLEYEKYGTLLHVVPTSCDVERLFSQCKLVLTDHRRSMHPKTFEQIMILKINSHLWDLNTVSEVCYHNKRAAMERDEQEVVVHPEEEKEE
eukprot:gene16908-23203_t